MIWFNKLLPKSRAFRLSKGKQITQFFTALENAFLVVKNFFIGLYLDIWPSTTTQLDLWENQFALPNDTGLTLSERRSRLDAAWKRTGGQSPYYIQTTLQQAGFDVWIHEWWVPGSEPPVARNPNGFITLPFIPPQCGEPLARCGEPSAQCTDVYTPSITSFIVEAGEVEAEAGNTSAEAGNYAAGSLGLGYLLVNNICQTVTTARIMECGEPVAQCGEPLAQCGENGGFTFVTGNVIYTIPPDPNSWPYFLYFCGETFMTPAIIPNTRREEFETLLLSICPAQQWLALFVIYT